MTSKEINLSAQKREKSGLSQLRNQGFIPAVVYGAGGVNENLKVKKSEFDKVFEAAGESHLINLGIEGGSNVKVLVKDVQRNPVKNTILHIDFFKVDMDKKITTEIPLRFVGESKAVKEQGGTLVKTIDMVEVKCLAKDLVDTIEVDIAALKDLHDAIRMHDLKLPQGIELVSQTDEIVVMVAEQQKEEAPAAPAAEAEATAQVEAEGEKKEEAGK